MEWEDILKMWKEATEGMTNEEIRKVMREAQDKPEVPSELVGKVGTRLAIFCHELRERGIDTVDNNAITNIALDISEDIFDYSMDERWIDYMEIHYNETFMDPDEGEIPASITIQVGQRDVQYDINGTRNAGGMMMFPIPKPWEEEEK